jgi:acetyltransferase-like isoleucine patch superfamily enzyme
VKPDARGVGLLVGDGVRIGEGVLFGANVVVHDGTVIGDGCAIADGAILGKRPSLGPRSTARGGPLEGLVLGDACRIGHHAVLSAGAQLGAGCVVGELASVRERVRVGEGVVVGRGVCVENDTTIGSGTRIQSNAYITAYVTLEEQVFIAPCVVTTNDNYMGRTQRRFAELRGPTVRRGARVGGAAVLLPGVDIGEEAFVGAGAIVTRDVPARTLVVGQPARPLREVAADELLDAGGHDRPG